MRKAVDRIQVNHTRTFDEISVLPFTDGMTVEMNISGSRSGWYPIRLSKAQWRRLRKAMDSAFETVDEDGGWSDAYHDGFKVGYDTGLATAKEKEVQDGI